MKGSNQERMRLFSLVSIVQQKMAIFSNDVQNCIFSQNGGKFITLSQIRWHYTPSLSYHPRVSYAAVFVSIFTQRKDIKKKCVGDYFLLTTPPVPFKYFIYLALLWIKNQININEWMNEWEL